MCGIFGILSTKEPIEINKVISARDILIHRGPDDAGIYHSNYKNIIEMQPPYVALAHRRLSIIDLSSLSHQPMKSIDGRYTIVYNGEIYNYNFIKRRFLNTINFRSNSDTEVIINLYDKFGENCLQFLRGMFAFAIWDEKEKKLFAARDRFGIKPFYYYKDKENFIFASEIKAIKYYKDNLTINFDALEKFLKTGSIPEPETIYNEVISLLPGHWIQIKFNNTNSSSYLEFVEKKYWDFIYLLNNSLENSKPYLNNSKLEFKYETTIFNNKNFNNYEKDISSLKKQQKFAIKLRYNNEVKKIIRAALLDTIEAHLVADVEVGAFLSGGIDSTSIVSLMRQVGQEKIKTVSIVFPDSRFDESKYSRLAAKTYNTEHVEIPFYEKDLLDDFENIMSVMDQPTIDGINTYFVSKAAKQAGLKVVLSGLGADELFGGYPSFNLIPKLRTIKNLPFAKMFMKFAAPLLKNKLPAKAIHYMKNPDEPHAEYRLIRGLFTDEELQTMGWKANSHQSSVLSPLTLNDTLTNGPMTNDQFTNDQLTNLQYVSMMESCYYMRNQLLRDSDVFSMAHSIELRVPFVDHLLYEIVLPYLDDAYDKNFPKKMLVEAVGDIPDEIVNRAKMGFTFPFEDWIRNGQLNKKFQKAIKNLCDKKIFIKEELDKYFIVYNLKKTHWSRIWTLLILESFLN